MGQAAEHIGTFRCLEGSSDAQSHVGRELGDYRLMQLIGEGGMGWVYLARHARIGRRVAIKMLRPELNADPVAVRRFFEEARAVNRIQHDNIVQVHDFVENEGGATYLVLELLVGQDLLGLLEADASPLPLERSLDIMAQAATALAEVHECGVVHRDLKPENIFLVERAGQPDLVKLLDFGIAKLRGGSNGRITKAGTSLGTPDYIAPEQALGADVDHRADIYSFGVILYELVTGQRPFASDDVTLTIARQVTEVPRRPSELRSLPRALDELVMCCLAKRPSERPQTMGEVGVRLRTIIAQLGEPEPHGVIELELGREPGSSGEAPPPEETPPARVATAQEIPPARRMRPRRLALAGAGLVALVVGTLVLARADVDTPPAAAASADAPSVALPPLEDPVTTTAAAPAPPTATAEPPPPAKRPRARTKRPPRATDRTMHPPRLPGHSDVLPVYED